MDIFVNVFSSRNLQKELLSLYTGWIFGEILVLQDVILGSQHQATLELQQSTQS